MSFKTQATVWAGFFTCFAAIATAQNAVTTPIYNWSYQRHSSTATEGYLRGAGAVIQANAQKNYLDSIALVNFREAQRKAIENSRLYVQTYLDNKETIRQYRERYAPVPPTKEEWARVVALSLPARLSSEQYNVDTGDLTWPHILRTDEYKALRVKVDELLAQRTPHNSGDGSPSQRKLATLIDGLKYILRTNLKTVTRSQYIGARTFLESLDYEMKFPMSDVISAAEPQTAMVIN